MATYDRKVTEQEDVATVVEFLRWGDPKDLMYHLAKHHTTLFAECLKEMNAPVVDWVPIDELLHQGRKIDAIKEYRAQTGQGLREAKDAVEDRQKRWRFGSSSPSEGATLGDILQNARKGVKE